MKAVMRQSRRNLLLILFYAACMGGLYYFDILNLISFETIKPYRNQLLAFVHQYAWISPFIYIIIYATLIALSIPVGVILTITGGFLFGSIWGTLYTVTGATLGATLLFLLAQTTLGQPLRDRAGPALTKLSKGFQENAFSYLLTLRLIPLFPFFTVNLVPALLGVPLRTYVIATALGIIPGTYVYTTVGSGIGAVFDRGEELNLQAILNPQIIIALVGLSLLSFLPMIYKKLKR